MHQGFTRGLAVLAVLALIASMSLLLPSQRIAALDRPSEPREGCLWFPETRHNLCGGFRAYWEANGGLPVFGYPLTEEMSERSPDDGQWRTVQYFERQRFEWHPENAGTPYVVLLGRLGSEILRLHGRDWFTFPKADPSVPHYFPETGHAIGDVFINYWSNHGLEFGDSGFSFRESLALFGYPLSQPQMETNSSGHTVLTQWFERARFEHHPGNPEPHVVLLGRLGWEMLDARKSEAANTTIRLDLVADGLTAPLALVPSPDNSGRMFVVDQIGLIRVIDADGKLLGEPFLDIRDRLVELNAGYDERGLLGLAFHPDYAINGRFFIYYSADLRESAPDDYDHTNVISEFHVSADNPNVADHDSERIILQEDWPYSNHNAGALVFGPDEYLYISMGDGGNHNDTGRGHVEDWYADNAGGNGQDVEQNLLGSILRIDVDGARPYSIPPDNPFVSGTGLDEIFAYGFRNPYRISFDMAGDHALYAADAGQALREEVSIVHPGGNYGWNVKEGSVCFNAEDAEHPLASCPESDDDGDPLIDPVVEFEASHHDNGFGVAVIGGYVYRGIELPGLVGSYVFGTWSASHVATTGKILVASPPAPGVEGWTLSSLSIADHPDGDIGHYLLGFGQDPGGEMYVLTSDESGPSGNTGKVYRIIAPQ